MNTRSLRVEEVTELLEFRQLRPFWDDLFDNSVESFPMLSHAWVSAWWEAFGNEFDCRVLLVWNGAALVAAAPLAFAPARLFGQQLRTVSLFSNTWVDRNNFLLRSVDPVPVRAMFEHICRATEFDVIDLYPLEDASAVTALVMSCAREANLKLGIDANLRSPYLKSPASWDDLLETLSPSFRQTVRRKIRKVEGMKNVSMRIVEDARCFSSIETISTESWQHENGTSMVSDPRIARFYRSIIEDAAQHGTLRCAIMEIDGQPAAFEFNLQHGATLHNFKLGFRQKYSELSTGIVLKAFIFRQALGQSPAQFAEYDFMGTAEPYKLNWTKAIRNHSHYYLFAPTLRMASTHWAYFRFKPWIREVPLARTMKNNISTVFRGSNRWASKNESAS
ncbi:MAG TPA: GNAT family N-acetyltransferase [Steroidobacteraceae bacterium]|nr:GNAT family N-acetyltransferase [Steroidobacteraceae bacterium]